MNEPYTLPHLHVLAVNASLLHAEMSQDFPVLAGISYKQFILQAHEKYSCVLNINEPL